MTKLQASLAKITLSLALLSLALAAPAGALMLNLSVGDMTSQAEHVVSGRVAAAQSAWSKDGRLIVTQVVLEVDEAYKGGLERGNIVLEFVGGEVGDVGLKVSDMVSLEENEQVIVFLQSSQAKADLGATVQNLLPNQGQDAAVYGILGNAQGKYSLSGGVASRSGYATVGGSSSAQSTLTTDELLNLIKLEVGNASGN